MAKMKIADDSIWFKHIEGDPALSDRLAALEAGEVIDLEVAGIFGRWVRMKDGKDGRATPGLKPIEAMHDVWAHLQRDRGKLVNIREVRSADSYLAALALMLSEWDSPEDETAYRDL